MRTVFSLQLHQNPKATCTLASGAQPPCFSCLLIAAQDGSGQPTRVSLSHRARVHSRAAIRIWKEGETFKLAIYRRLQLYLLFHMS